MTAARPATALLICEDPPADGLAGAPTYNRAVLAALEALGYQVDVIVTTPRIGAIGHVDPVRVPGRSVRYLHARIAQGRLVVNSLPARLRALKYWLSARTGRRSSPGASRIAQFGRPLPPGEVARIRRIIGGTVPDLVVIDTIFRAPALEAVPRSVSRLLVAHDIFANRTASFRGNGFTVATPVDPVEEAAIWRRFDRIVAISPTDAKAIAAQVEAPVASVLPVLDPVADPAPSAATGADLLYIGTAAYHNVDGLRWFIDQVWPAIHAARPDLALRIVGNIRSAFPDPVPGIEFLGRVDDLPAIARRCAFAVNPVRMGSGIKIKMVDYFRLGLPCIVTPEGAEGFPDDLPTPFRVATGPEGFAAAVIEWAGGDGLAEYRQSITRYIERFSQPEAVSHLRDLLQTHSAGRSDGEP